MPYGDEQNEEDIILDVVYRTVLANPQTIETVVAGQLSSAGRSWISGEAVYGSLNSKVLQDGNPAERLFCFPADPDLVLRH